MTVIMHHHIYKNAGSTVDWVLHQNFPGNVLHIEGDRPNARLTPQQIQDAASPYPDHRAITSHCAPLPDADSIWAQFHLTLLRDPIDRFYSMYRFARRQVVGGPPRNIAKERDFKGYCEWWLGKPDTIISNWQARCCTPQQGASRGGKAGRISGWDVDLDAARSAITELGFVGTVKEFDKSMLVLECRMAQRGIQYDASYRTLNASPDEPVIDDDMHNHIIGLLGKSLYDCLMEANSLDYELLAVAGQLVNERFSAIEDAELKLEDFRNRCETRAAAEPGEFVRVPDRDERIVVADDDPPRLNVGSR